MQNLIFFRFTTPSWNRSGTGNTSRACRSPWRRSLRLQGRGAFYDETGTIRDVLQNHLMQLLSNVAMEPPRGSAEALRDERVKVLKSVLRSTRGHGAGAI